MMNLPNILTLSRIIFAVILVYLLLQATLWGNICAAFIFLIASITDFYDGYLAKKWGLISNFGKIMDPIADKVLILAVLSVMAYLTMIAWWMVIIIAIREIWVTLDRLYSMRQGLVLSAEIAGKIKTVLQMTTISLSLIFLISKQAFANQAWFHDYQAYYFYLIQIFMISTVCITLTSGISYFKNKIKDKP